MASQLLTIPGDLSPLMWIKGGAAPSHAASVSHDDTTRNIYALLRGLTDHLDLGNSPGDVDTLTHIDFLTKFNITNRGAVGWIGIEWSVWALGGQIGVLADTYGNDTMYELTMQVPIVGGQAEANDLSFKILSQGAGGWDDFGAAIIQIYKIEPMLVYEPPPPDPQGIVTLRHDRAISGPLQLERKLVTLRADRAIEGPVRLKRNSVTLRADRAIAGPIQLKTRRPG